MLRSLARWLAFDFFPVLLVSDSGAILVESTRSAHEKKAMLYAVPFAAIVTVTASEASSKQIIFLMFSLHRFLSLFVLLNKYSSSILFK